MIRTSWVSFHLHLLFRSIPFHVIDHTWLFPLPLAWNPDHPFLDDSTTPLPPLFISTGNKVEKSKKGSKEKLTRSGLKRFQFPPTDPIEKHYTVSDTVLGTYTPLSP